MLEAFGHTFEPLLPAVSFVGSAASLGITSYCWFVKMNRERPNLAVEGVDHVTYVDLGLGTEESRWLLFRLGLVVVNNSTLPNAVLGVTVKAMPRTGGAWEPVGPVRPARGSAFPVNLPALQSGLVTIDWAIEFPTIPEGADVEMPDQIVSAYLNHYWKLGEQVMVEVRGTQGKTFSALVPLGGTRMSAPVREHLEAQSR